MFKGFNLEVADGFFEKWLSDGRISHRRNKFSIEGSLNTFFDNDGKLSAAKISEGWFPKIGADVFISHSHVDSQDAIGLAGWLHANFGLTAFIDSTVWGHSERLLKKLDDKYCLKNNGETYSYEKRNKTTTHVNIILSAALHRMIDECECVIFLNTPNSVTCEGYVTKSATHSPWIFSEISMTQLIRARLRRPSEKLRKAEAAYDSVRESIDIKYDLSLNHLTSLTSSELDYWAAQSKRAGLYGVDALDILYELAK